MLLYDGHPGDWVGDPPDDTPFPVYEAYLEYDDGTYIDVRTDEDNRTYYAWVGLPDEECERLIGDYEDIDSLIDELFLLTDKDVIVK